MKIAIAGLGRMGQQIARKLIENQHSVVAYDVTEESLQAASSFGAVAARSKQSVIDAFGSEQVVLWLMIPANLVDAELDSWLALLPAGSIIIDGGNSDFRLTRQRAEKVQASGQVLVDCGTSGGVWGYQNGFSMMIGGDEQAFRAVQPIFEALAKPQGAYHHFGPAGSGHYVKMIHNAVEYGMMESLAEGYRMLKEGPYTGLDLAAVGEVWQHGSVVQSWLNDLARQALAENPNLDGIDGFVAESGEARWTIETAQELSISLPAIQSAFDVRAASQSGNVSFTTKLLAALRNKFGGHTINKT